MPTFMRVTLGTEREMDAFYTAFREIARVITQERRAGLVRSRPCRPVPAATVAP